MDQSNIEVGSRLESGTKGLDIVDQRKSPDVVQVNLLSERIKNDRVIAALEDIKKMMSPYSTDVNPESILVALVDGEWGSGEYTKGVLKVALPSDREVVELMMPCRGYMLKNLI